MCFEIERCPSAFVRSLPLLYRILAGGSSCSDSGSYPKERASRPPSSRHILRQASLCRMHKLLTDWQNTLSGSNTDVDSLYKYMPLSCTLVARWKRDHIGWTLEGMAERYEGTSLQVCLKITRVLLRTSYDTFHHSNMNAVSNTMRATSNGKALDKFTLRQARLWDLGSIARVWHKAFFDDEIIGDIMHPNRRQYPEHVYWFLLRGVRERFWDWRHQFMVVVMKDSHDKEVVIGAADWRRLGDGGVRRELFRLDPREDTRSCLLQLLLIVCRELDCTDHPRISVVD